MAAHVRCPSSHGQHTLPYTAQRLTRQPDGDWDAQTSNSQADVRAKAAARASKSGPLKSLWDWRFIRSRSAFGIIGDLHSGGAHAAGMLKEP
jgi:hypothetical protein